MENVSNSEISSFGGNDEFSPSFKALPKISFVVLAMSLLVGCGGSSGGGNPDGIFGIPANDDILVVTEPTPNPNPIQDPTPDPNPITEPEPNPQPDPIPELVQEPDPLSEQTPLSQLFGRTIFAHNFTGSEASFIYDASFGPEDLSDDEFDDLLLSDTVVSAFRESPDSDFEFFQSERMVCAFVESNEQFLCIVFFENGDSSNFSFDPLVGDESLGNFSFCTADQSVSECVDELLNSPDGVVFVSVIEEGIASRFSLTQLDTAKNSPGDTSVVPYLEYENQGSLGTLQDRSSVDSGRMMPFLEAFEYLKEHANVVNPD